MVKEDFWYNGVSAKSMGITLREPVVVGGAIPRVERVSVPGRSGDLVYFDGSYENRPAEASCFALKARNVMQSITRVNNWLLGDFGYKELVIPEDRDHFFLATVENGAEINTKLAMLAPFEIEFNCKPQRFLNIGKKTLSFYSEINDFKNPTMFTSHPLLIFYPQNPNHTQAAINGSLITTTDAGTEAFAYDAQTQHCYRYSDGLNFNNRTRVSGEIFLKPGDNEIDIYDGISRIEVIPRWWEL